MTNVVAVYHRDCPDGTTAAACLLAKYPDAKVFAIAKDYTPQDLSAVLACVTDETEAYTLDCAISAKELAQQARALTIIDHHISIEAEMRSFAAETDNVTFIFDNEHSGAGLAWPYFHPDTEVPELVTLVEDYDIAQRKHVERAQAVSLYLSTLFNQPEQVVPFLTGNADDLVSKGEALIRYTASFADRFVEKYAPVWGHIGEHKVAFFNATIPEISLRSEVGARLYGKYAQTVCLFGIQGDVVSLSFRSEDAHTPSALDLASILGGGGHRNAAGASVTRAQLIQMLG